MSKSHALLITHYALLITAFRQSYYMLLLPRYVKDESHSGIACELEE